MGQNESAHFDSLDDTIMDRGSYRRHSFQGTSSNTLDVKPRHTRSLSSEDLLRRNPAGLKALTGGGGTLRRDVLKRQQGLRRKDFSVNPRWSDPTPWRGQMPPKNVKGESAVKGDIKLKEPDPRLASSEKLHRKRYTDQGQGQQLRYDSDDSFANIKKKRKKHRRSKNKENIIGYFPAESETKTEHSDEMEGLLRNDKTEVKVTVNAADVVTDSKVIDNITEDSVTPKVRDNKTEIMVTADATDVKSEPKVKVSVAANVKTGIKVATIPPPGHLDVMKVSRSRSMSNIHVDKDSRIAPQQSLIHPVLTQQTEREYDFQSLRQYYESLAQDDKGRSMTLPKQTLAMPIDGARLKRALSASDIHEITKPSVIFHTPSTSSRMDVDLVNLDQESSKKKKEKKKKKRHHHRSCEKLDNTTSGSEKAAPAVITIGDEAVRRETKGISVDIRSVKRMESDVGDVMMSKEVLLKSSGSNAAGNDAGNGANGLESFKAVDDTARFVDDKNETIEEISKASFASKVAIFEQSKHIYDNPGAHLEKKGLRKSKDCTDFESGEIDGKIVPTGSSQVAAVPNGLSLLDYSAAHPGTVENVVTSVTMTREQGTAQEIGATSAASSDENKADVCKTEKIIILESSLNVMSRHEPNKDVDMEDSDLESVHSHPDLMSIPSIEITYVEDVDQTENPEFVPLSIGNTSEEQMENGVSSVGETTWRDDSMDIEESRAAIVEDVIYQDVSVGGVFASQDNLDELDSRLKEDQSVRGQKDSVTFAFPPTFHEGVDDLETFTEGPGRDRACSKDSVGTITTVSSLSSSCSSGGFEDYMLENLAREQQTMGEVQKCGKGWNDVKDGAVNGISEETLSKTSSCKDSAKSSESESGDHVKTESPKRRKKHKKVNMKDRKESTHYDADSDGVLDGVKGRRRSPSGEEQGLSSIDDILVTIATTEAVSLATKPPRAERPNSLEIGKDAKLLLMMPAGVADDDDTLIVLTGDNYPSDHQDQKNVLEALVLWDRSSSVKTPTTPRTPSFPPHDKNGVLSDFDLLDMSLVKYKADLKELEMLADVVYKDNMDKLSHEDRETLVFISSIHSEIYDEVTSVERQLLDIRGKVETIPIALEQECYLVANMMKKVISLLKEQLYHNGIIECLQEEYSPQLLSQAL